MDKTTLRELRENAGLSVQQVSKKLNLCRNAIYNYELGLRSLSIDTACDLALIYKVSVDEIAVAYFNTRKDR